MQNLILLAEEQLHCAAEEERLSAEAKQFRDRKDEIRITLLPDAMKRAGLVQSNGKGSFTFPGGKVSLETSLKVSCTNDKKPALFRWLRANNLGDVIKEDVGVQALGTLVKDRREDNLPDPPGLSIFEQVKSRITKARK